MIRSIKGYAVPAAIGLALLGFGWFVMRHGPMAPLEVKVAAVKQYKLAPSIFGIGTVEARVAYAIGSTQAGRVRSVAVDQGDSVKAGQTLGEIDPVDLDERLNSASLAEQRAKQAILLAETQVREATSRQRLAAANAERYRNLVAKGFVSKEMAEVRRIDAEVAQAALDGAQAAMQAARQDAARAGAERAGVARQRANFRLVSPADGLIVSREAEPGSTVVAGQAVLRMIDPHSLWVRARIDQSQARGIVPGQPAEIVLRSRQAEKLAGRVVRIEAQSDSVTEERVVDVRFEHPPEGLSPGELAEATILLPPIANALAVPTAAVKRVNGQSGVWRRTDGKAHFQPITPGIRTLDGKVQVLAGLSIGDEVIAHSPAELQEGMKVAVKP